MTNKVDKPDHYNQGEIECLDAIKSALTKEEFRGFVKGSIFKYVWREKYKGGDEDLLKARRYLNELLFINPIDITWTHKDETRNSDGKQ